MKSPTNTELHEYAKSLEKEVSGWSDRQRQVTYSQYNMNKQNKLRNCRYYSAGPLEFNSDNNALNWRQQVHDELDKIGCIHLDPTKQVFTTNKVENDEIRLNFRQDIKDGKWDEVAEYFSKVIYLDTRCIDVCDFVIFNFHDFKIPTVGTIHEIVLASQTKKPCFIICEDINDTPFWLIGLLKKKSYFYNSVESCLSMIKKLDSGEVEMDSRKWKLLKEGLRQPMKTTVENITTPEIIGILEHRAEIEDNENMLNSLGHLRKFV